jgi:hypothetical protein
MGRSLDLTNRSRRQNRGGHGGRPGDRVRADTGEKGTHGAGSHHQGVHSESGLRAAAAIRQHGAGRVGYIPA